MLANGNTNFLLVIDLDFHCFVDTYKTVIVSVESDILLLKGKSLCSGVPAKGPYLCICLNLGHCTVSFR